MAWLHTVLFQQHIDFFFLFSPALMHWIICNRSPCCTKGVVIKHTVISNQYYLLAEIWTCPSSWSTPTLGRVAMTSSPYPTTTEEWVAATVRIKYMTYDQSQTHFSFLSLQHTETLKIELLCIFVLLSYLVYTVLISLCCQKMSNCKTRVVSSVWCANIFAIFSFPPSRLLLRYRVR